jgi:hypothetical protein
MRHSSACDPVLGLMRPSRYSPVLTLLVLAAVVALGADIALRWQASRPSPPVAATAAPGPQGSRVAALTTTPVATAPVATTRVATAPDPASPTGTAQSPVVLVDDMAKSDNGIDGSGLVGYWYTYSDGTGQIVPAAGSSEFLPIAFQGRRAREFSGRGQEKWGAGFGFDLSRDDTAKKGAAPFDATAFSGIQFDVLSKSAPLRLRVSFPDADTDPRGGACDKTSTKTSVACFGDYGLELDVPQDSWVERRVSFSQVSIPAWSLLKAAVEHGLRKSALYSIHFAVRPDGTKLAPFDVLVANVFFFI